MHIHTAEVVMDSHTRHCTTLCQSWVFVKKLKYVKSFLFNNNNDVYKYIKSKYLFGETSGSVQTVQDHLPLCNDVVSTWPHPTYVNLLKHGGAAKLCGAALYFEPKNVVLTHCWCSETQLYGSALNSSSGVTLEDRCVSFWHNNLLHVSSLLLICMS